MGYRSDVGYVIRFKDTASLKEFVSVHAINEDTRAALEECEVCAEDNTRPELHFTAVDVKWYESFPDVQAHEALLSFIDDMDEPYASYLFVRVGEETDDNENRYGGDYDYVPWDAIGIHRVIQWDVGRTIKDERGTVAIVSEV